MDLYIIRHGQSQNNAIADERERVQDPPLTPVGEQQADLVAAFVAAGGHLMSAERSGERPSLDYLYTSAMGRSLQTSYPIGKALDLAPEVWLEIHEWGGIYLNHSDERGVVGYPGLGCHALLERFPGYVLPLEFPEEGWWPVERGQEQDHAAFGRSLGVAQALRARAGENSRIGMVSHGGFMESLLKALLGVVPGDGLTIDHNNTAITHLRFTMDGVVVVDYVNRVDHLDAEMVT